MRGTHTLDQAHAADTSTNGGPSLPWRLAALQTVAGGRALRPGPVSSASVDDGRATSRDEFEMTPAEPSDHGEIYRFLTTVEQGPTRGQFRHDNEAPRYESLDRLLIRRNLNIVAHLQLAHRNLRFGDMVVPTIDIRHLAALPEFQSHRLVTRLLDAVQFETNLHGALLCTVNAQTPGCFLKRGWVPWLQHCQSTVSPRSLLSELQQPQPQPRSPHRRSGARGPRVTIRPWRRHELDSLIRLFAAESAFRFGAVERDSSDWEWLIHGKGFDRIYVAVEHRASPEPRWPHGPATVSVDRGMSGSLTDDGEIIGYAVMRHNRVVELVGRPDTDAMQALLTRACRECIENGHHTLHLDAAPDDPIHDWFQAAGGVHRQLPQKDGRMLMARLLRPWEFLKRLSPLLHARAMQANIQPVCQLGIAVGDEHFRLNIGRKQANVVSGKIPVDTLTLDSQGLSMLLLGQADIPQLIRCDRAYASTRNALELSKSLFPMVPGWRMPWDDLAPLDR